MLAKEAAAKGGQGYPPAFRGQTLNVEAASTHERKEDKVSETADVFGVSGRSIYRWASRHRQTGDARNLEHKGGVTRTLDGEGDVCVSKFNEFPSVLLCDSRVSERSEA